LIELADGRLQVFGGDSREVLKTFAPDTFDSIVTDPPYSLASIVKRFGAANAAPAKGDVYARASSGFIGQTWDTEETAFSAEFWAQCLRVLKPGGFVLAMAAARNYHRLAYAIEDAGFEVRDMIAWLYGTGFPKSHSVKLAGLEGWGTALKPAIEPICMARKPLSEKTIAANVLKWGTGAINIDASRIETDERAEGRWPANVVHDGSAEVAEAFPTMATARFFYSAKANKKDRAGSKHPTVKPVSLNEYLCTLVTPKGGTVLDPFAGSGSTGQAALNSGFNAVLIERESEYVADIKKRLDAALEHALYYGDAPQAEAA
jgi:site-specific DNA-methyltransferase (adenine-specific)